MNSLVRWCASHCISWWTDAKHPTWLQAALQRNEQLQRCERELDTIANRLRTEASDWANIDSSQAVDTVPEIIASTHQSRQQPMLPRPVFYSLSLAVAASIVFLLLWRFQGSPNDMARKSPAQTISVADVQRANDELRALVNVCSQSLRSIESSLANLSSLAGSTLVADANTIPEAIVQPVESLSRGYGRALAFIARDAQIEDRD